MEQELTLEKYFDDGTVAYYRLSDAGKNNQYRIRTSPADGISIEMRVPQNKWNLYGTTWTTIGGSDSMLSAKWYLYHVSHPAA